MDFTNKQLPGVTVDPLVFTVKDSKLYLLLNKRLKEPFKDYYYIPGGFLRLDESLLDNAKRTLSENTNLNNLYLEQLYTFGDIDRDPRMRVLSVSYLALCPYSSISKQDINKSSSWVEIKVNKNNPLEVLLDGRNINDELAFDHLKMINYAIDRMQNKVFYTDIAFSLVESEFTLNELQTAYELILGYKLHTSNFRRDITPKVERLDILNIQKKGRPSYYYRRKI